MTAPPQPIFGALTRGWRWWTRELASLVPAPRRRRAEPGIVVSAEGAGLRVVDERGARRARPAERSGEDAWDALAALARQRPQPAVRLRLPYSSCFVRRVDLPEAAREEAGRFLALDLERSTPFRLADVYTAHFVDEARARPGIAALTQLIVRRDAIDKARAEVESTGVKIAAVDCWSEDGANPLPVDFLPREPASERERGAGLVKLLAATAAALSISAGFIAVSRHESALAELTRFTAEARAKAAAMREKQETADLALAEARALEQLRSSRRPTVETIDALTRLLPDTVWLTSLKIEGDSIEVSGEAQPAAPLISLVESAPMFSDAAFTAPVTRDGKDARERFSLKARIGEGTAVFDPAERR